MKSILTLVAAATFATTASSQILSEDFSTGVPPAGWTVVDVAGSGVIGWVPGIFDPYTGVDRTEMAFHDYDYLLPADTLLISPTMDLSSSNGTTLTFLTETEWAEWMAHHPYTLSNGVSTAEVSTDGGASWTVVWTDDVIIDFNPVTISVDLSAYDGMNNVQVAFRYFGFDAHSWWVDDVEVGNGPGPNYSILGLAGGGNATLTVSGATAGGGVLIGYSLTGAGPTVTPFGPVAMSMPISQLPTLTANASGVASMTTGVPAQASGFTLYSQAADLSSGVLTNALAELIL